MRRLGIAMLLLIFVPVGISDASDLEPHDTVLVDDHLNVRGNVSVWNSATQIHIDIDWENGWFLSRYSVDIGEGDPPMSMAGNPLLGSFDYEERFGDPDPLVIRRTLIIDLLDLGFPQAVNISVFCNLIPVQGNGKRQINTWAFGPYEFPGPAGGYWFLYEIQQPQ